MSEDYAYFAQCVAGHERKIAQRLGVKINFYVKKYYGADFPALEDKLEAFFSDVYDATGQTIRQNPKKKLPVANRFSELLGNWRSAENTRINIEGNTVNSGSTVLAVPAYYYLHTKLSGQSIAEYVDREIFGTPFKEKFSGGVPGGYVADNSRVNIQLRELPSSPQPTLNPAAESSHDFHYSKAKFEILGRKEEQETLRRFTSSDPGFLWLQLAGAGGQGKSRLANELILELGKEWAAGFLWKDDLEDFKSQWRTWHPSKPHLIVIDYVIGLESMIGDAMRGIARRSKDLLFPVRILLVERQRWDRGSLEWRTASALNEQAQLAISAGKADWFYKLNKNHDGKDLSHSNYLSGSGVVELTTLGSAHLVQIVRHVVELENQQIEQSDEFIAKSLNRIDRSGRPLYAYFFAHALIDGRFRPDWDNANLLSFILERDYDRRWTSAGTSTPTLDSGHPAVLVVVLATMIRSLNNVDLSLTKLPELNDQTWRLALLLSDTPAQGGLMGPSDVICGIEPDILGEWLVLSYFQKSLTFVEHIVTAAWSLKPTEMATFMLRVAQDFPHHPATTKILQYQPPSHDAMKAYTEVATTIIHVLATARCPFPKQTMQMLEIGAQSGDGRAMANLGFCYSIGQGVELDYKKAAKWFRKGIKTGDALAMVNLGCSYGNALGVKRNHRLAFHLYHKGNELGEPSAAARIGSCYSNGQGVEKDDAKAFDWFNIGAQAGDALAMNNLGFCYAMGVGVGIDDAQAISWYQKSAELGNAGAMANFAYFYSSGRGVKKNISLAIDWLLKAIEGGDSYAMMLLGSLYTYGDGVEKSPEQAFKWFLKSAEAGSIEGMMCTAVSYREGTGVEFNEFKAFGWTKKAAELGHSAAMAGVGCLYDEGCGVEKDQLKAIEWYRKGAFAGNEHAMLNLGYCYAEALGVERDIAEALKWYSKAANLGLSAAMTNLGFCYSNGLGVKKDLIKAFDYYSKGADGGDVLAMVRVGICYAEGTGVGKNLVNAIAWRDRLVEIGCDDEICTAELFILQSILK